MMKATNLFLIFLSFFSISTSAQYVKFESVNLVCDAVVNGQVGLKIVATYTVTAQPGHTLYVDLGVMDSYGNPIYRPDGYTVFDRIVKKQTRKTQRYVNDAVFLPAWAFSNLTGGSYQLNAVVQVMDADSNMSLGVSNYVQFAYNGGQQQYPNNIITAEMLQENQQNVECATVQESAGCVQVGEKNDILEVMEFQEA